MKLQAFSFLAGAGLAFTTVLPPAGVTLSVPGYLLGTASTLTQATRALGGIVGITVFTAIHKCGHARCFAIGD